MRHDTSRRATWQALSVALGLALWACDPSDPCDPGYYADHGACYMRQHDAGSELGAGAEPVDAQVDPYAGFGTACTQSSECPSTAPSCGAPMFAVCTIVNCLDKASDTCPPHWTCLDVTTLSPDPTVHSVCVNF